MTEVEYCVHVSNKFALFTDDAPDPSDLFQQLAVIKPAAPATKDDKITAKKSKDLNVKKPASQETAHKKTESAEGNTTSNKQHQSNKAGEYNRTSSKFDEQGQQRRDEHSVRGDRSGRVGSRGRGGNRGGGTFTDKENNENRRPRNTGAALPPRMSNAKRGAEFGTTNRDFNQENNQDNTFGSDKFAERFGETPRERGYGRGGRGRGRSFRRGGGFGGHSNNDGFGGGGGGFNNSNNDNIGGNFNVDSGGGGNVFGSTFGQEQNVHSTGGGGFGASGFGSGGFNGFGTGGSAFSSATETGVFGGHFESPPTGNFGGGGGGYDKGRGRSRGFGRGRGRGGGRGRVHDRQSGSDRSGVKAVDKREGGGAHNWGSTGDDIEAGTEVITGEETVPNNNQTAEDRDAKRENESDANAQEKDEPVKLTFDEWKALQGPRSKPAFNIRRPGEGENDKKEKLIPLAREKFKDEEEVEYVVDDEKRRKPVAVPIPINFIDEAARGGARGGGGGGGLGRGPRGAFRGRGRGGGGRGDDFSFGGGGNRRGGFGGFDGGFSRGFSGGGERRGTSARPSAPYKMDDETFPSLA